MLSISFQVSEGDYESRIHELEQQLQSGLREKEAVRQQLTRKEAELARADEIIRREQQQIQEMRQGVSNCVTKLC